MLPDAAYAVTWVVPDNKAAAGGRRVRRAIDSRRFPMLAYNGSRKNLPLAGTIVTPAADTDRGGAA